MVLTTEKEFATARHHHYWRKCNGLFLMVVAVFGIGVVLLADSAKSHPVSATAVFLLCMGGMGIGALMYAKPLFLKCPKCRNNISADESWRCGACHHERRKMDEWSRYSFLGRCGNKDCKHVPTAYECHFCRTLIYLSAERDPRVPARSLHPHPLPEPSDPRQERVEHIEERELDIRHLEIDRRQLILEIENARLRRALHQPEPVEVSPRQQRVNWMVEQIEDAELCCRTIAETVEREVKAHAVIDDTHYHADRDLDAHVKEQMKEAISRAFETIRIGLGGDVRVQKKGHR